MDNYDYIIIGAGSAGCVLANRLSENPKTSVLLLEAGGKNTSILVKMPAGVGTLIEKPNTWNWGFRTQPEPHLNNRELFWARGKGLGGSSAINGMLYIRGHARDYDEWSQLGLRGWSYDDVLPYFRKSEGHEGGENPYHGGDGALKISGPKYSNPLMEACVEASMQAGYPFTKDFNGPEQEGVGWYDYTIQNHERQSAAVAFLKPILSRPNLTCLTGAAVARIVLEEGRATGVAYSLDNGKTTKTAHVNGEVLLSAGAIQSPQILQVSGIGDPEDLRAAGIAPLHALTGVGRNLQDHLDIAIGWKTAPEYSLYQNTKWYRKLITGMQYNFARMGKGTGSGLEVGAFLKSREGLERPDVQLHVVGAIAHGAMEEVAKVDGFAIHACQLRPESRGRVVATSADASEPPQIFANYLSESYDRDVMRQAFKMVMNIGEQAALKPYIKGLYKPEHPISDDAEIDAWIRKYAETIYHPVGTCKMANANDPEGVVDDQLRVRGVTGLRVVDASVMPRLIGGNTNAPTIMIAEKAADMIKGAAG